MRLLLTIQCDNAAFEDDPAAEVARILRETADGIDGSPAARRLDRSGDLTDRPLRDVNGNTVGRLEVLP